MKSGISIFRYFGKHEWPSTMNFRKIGVGIGGSHCQIRPSPGKILLPSPASEETASGRAYSASSRCNTFTLLGILLASPCLGF
jgi:hypothetical protein